ncbi:hypothetical protein CDD80_892 [Ophiocordyceps camponoti-rufipedis]|uniref:Uncharacterized protein n=1 Tax=Ophiocordyceps camponoti-rufipedis TaxID=2004952 RepID=A0A2C5YC88_9HYPO|nr:hypothetical protein CDD80_892 [Ophiocordyceps camponoti-rufipedis]
MSSMTVTFGDVTGTMAMATETTSQDTTCTQSMTTTTRETVSCTAHVSGMTACSAGACASSVCQGASDNSASSSTLVSDGSSMSWQPTTLQTSVSAEQTSNPNYPWGGDSPVHRHGNATELGVGDSPRWTAWLREILW